MHTMTRLGKIADIQAGLVTKTAGKSRGVRVLTMASLAGMRVGSLSPDDLPEMVEDQSMREKQYRLRMGDVLIPSRTTGDYLEPSIVWDSEMVDRPFNATLLCVRSRDVDPWWLYGFLGSEIGKARILQGSQSGTAQLSLGAKSVGEVEISLPSTDRQVRIGKLIRSAHDARRNAVQAADLRLKLAYAAAFQHGDDENF